MLSSISIDNLADTIVGELQNYKDEIDEVMQFEIDDLSNEIKMDLSNDKNIPKRTGDYAKSFYVKKIAKGKGYKRNVVANKKYQLTHLLEFPHATRNGGITKAFPHWKYAQQKADTLPNRIERRLNNG